MSGEHPKELWQRAQNALKSAEVLVGVSGDDAASRAYYAAFHAVSALFATRGQVFSKHTAVRAAVHRDLVHTASEAAHRRGIAARRAIRCRRVSGVDGGCATCSQILMKWRRRNEPEVCPNLDHDSRPLVGCPEADSCSRIRGRDGPARPDGAVATGRCAGWFCTSHRQPCECVPSICI
ncbi:MAG: HEPN domain-containing protein [Armatimonadetes bacterium]|nr:HEPN domain-containing protein [Armatimonadota bacterium]